MNLLHMKNQRKLCITYNWLKYWNCCTSVYPMVQKNQISRSKAATPKSMFSALFRIQLPMRRSLASLHVKAKEQRYDNNRDWMMVRHGIGHGLAIRFLILLEWSNHPHHRIFKQPQVLFLFYAQLSAIGCLHLVYTAASLLPCNLKQFWLGDLPDTEMSHLPAGGLLCSTWQKSKCQRIHRAWGITSAKLPGNGWYMTLPLMRHVSTHLNKLSPHRSWFFCKDSQTEIIDTKCPELSPWQSTWP